jgi:hypothetical protein
MARRVIDIEVALNMKDSAAKARELQLALKQVPLGTKEYNKIFNELDGLQDRLKGAKKGASDWVDSLEMAGGPLGLIGKGINSFKVSFSSLNALIKTSVIGLLVTAVGGLVGAFAKSETATKKLQPLMIGLEKIFNGIFKAVEPLFDALLDLAMKALPYVTEYIGTFYSGLVALFTLVKEAGIGVGQILKGIFTLDFDAVEAGWDRLTGSWDKAVVEFKAGMKRYDEGVAQTTKTEKANIEDRIKAREAELEANKKNADAQRELDKQNELAKATTEAEKLAIERKYQDLAYQADKKTLQDRIALYGKNSNERKGLQAELIKLEADRIAQQTANREKDREMQAADLQTRLNQIKDAGAQEVEAQKRIAEIKKELYGQDSLEAEKAAQAVITARKQANDAEMQAIADLIAGGKTLTDEQKKRYEELKTQREIIVQDQNKLNVEVIRNDANRNVKLNDNDQARLAKVAENEQLGYDIRLNALTQLKLLAEQDAQVKLNALEQEKLKRIADGEDEISVAKYVAEQKRLIEQGLTDQITPYITQRAQLTKQKNEESFQSFLQLGTAISQASGLFKEGTAAAKAFAAVQDLVTIAQQANIIVTNLQTLGILAKANAEVVDTTATMGAATAQGVKSGAKLPFPANLIAIAAIVGAIITIFATIKKLFGAKGKVDTSSAKAAAPAATQAATPYSVQANRASGGLITGAGTSTSDSIMANLSNGEYVVNARSTAAFLPLLTSINELGKQPRFYSGGLAQSPIMQPMMAGTLTNTMMANGEIPPIKTYVVSQEMTNHQQLDRLRKTRSMV